MSELWQAGASVHVGPGLAADNASIEEVRRAVRKQGLDDSRVEEIDTGLFLIPITPETEARLLKDHYVIFSVEVPTEPGPKEEFGGWVTFDIDAGEVKS